MDTPELDSTDALAIELGIKPKNVRPLHESRRGWKGLVDTENFENNVFGFKHTIKKVPFFIVVDLRTYIKNNRKSTTWFYMADVYVFDTTLGRLVKVGRPSIRKRPRGKFMVEPSDFYKQIARANGARKQFLGEGWW